MDKNLRNFANGLKRARKKAGYKSQKKFVEALNEAYKAEDFSVTVDTVENWEQGKASPAMSVFLKLCDFFGCSADYLLCKIDEENHDLHFICEYTGLSTEAVEKLHNDETRNYAFDRQSKSFISRLITEYLGPFHDIYTYIAGAIDSQAVMLSKYNADEDFFKKVSLSGIGVKTKPPILNAKRARDFMLSEASQVFRDFIKEYVQEAAKIVDTVQAAPKNENGPAFNDVWHFDKKPIVSAPDPNEDK